MTIRDARRSDLSTRDAFDEFFNKPLTGSTTDGWEFSAAAAGAASWSFHTAGNEHSVEVRIEGWDWRLVAGEDSGTKDGGSGLRGSKPTIWAATLAWDPPDYFGNLELRTSQGGFSRGHYFLKGPEYNYALLKEKQKRERWVMIVQEREGELLHAALRRDLNALACAFGTPLTVERLTAVDDDLRVTGFLGGSLARRSRRGTPGQCPVPSRNDFGALPVLFFERLTSHLKEVGARGGAGLTLATWYFIESLEEYSADATVVKMTLAILAASRYLQQGDVSLVNDEEAFADWVTRHDEELALFEPPDANGALRRQVAHSHACDARAVVDLAMKRANLQLLPELRAALRAGLRALEGRVLEDERLHSYLPALRAIASALIATAIDYRGRIAGWTRAAPYAFFLATPEDWWKGDAEARATYYRATAKEQIPDIGRLWPDVQLPSVPTSGPIALLSAHGASLSASTEGRVLAEVRPLPSDDQVPGRQFAFVLRAARRPTAKVVLFLLVEQGPTVTVEGWDEPRTLSSPSDVVHFLGRVAEASQTRSAIERLLIASFEAEQDAQG